MIVKMTIVMEPLTILPDAPPIGHVDQMRTGPATKQYQDWQFRGYHRAMTMLHRCLRAGWRLTLPRLS
jgi:hypothetical protein